MEQGMGLSQRYIAVVRRRWLPVFFYKWGLVHTVHGMGSRSLHTQLSLEIEISNFVDPRQYGARFQPRAFDIVHTGGRGGAVWGNASVGENVSPRRSS